MKRLPLLLCAAVSAAQASAPLSGDRNCATRLASAFPTAAVRAELSALAEEQRKAPRKYAAGSPLRGEEAAFIPTLESPAPQQVLSLGSGGDIYRPLRDFPFAQEIHLVDTLTGWGKSPSAVLVEIDARLAALPGAEVRVQRGFTQGFEVIELCSLSRYLRKMESHPHRLMPFIWEVRWHSPAAGPLHHRVTLNVMSYHDPDEFPALVDRVTARGPLVGVLVTGAREPEEPSQSKFLEALDAHGRYIFETFGAAPGEDAPAPSDAQIAAFERLNYDAVPVGDWDGAPNLIRTYVAIPRR